MRNNSSVSETPECYPEILNRGTLSESCPWWTLHRNERNELGNEHKNGMLANRQGFS